MRLYIALTVLFALLMPSPAQTAPVILTYPSSIDPIPNLTAKVLPGVGKDLPMLLVVHGYTGSKDSISTTMMERFASYGLCVVVPEMRGRGKTAGRMDSSGREVYDLYDGLKAAHRAFPSSCSSGKIIALGYSGGGGSVMALATKFPELLAGVISYFGMCDYAAWWQSTPFYRPVMERTIGGTPAAVADAYAARNHCRAASNVRVPVWLFHDAMDGSVPVAQSRMFAEGLADARVSITNAASPVRWLHGYPVDGSPLIQSEAIWSQDVAGLKAARLPMEGTVEVAGYVRTRLFELWLGDGTSAVGSVRYDLRSKEFVITTDAPTTTMKLLTVMPFR